MAFAAVAPDAKTSGGEEPDANTSCARTLLSIDAIFSSVGFGLLELRLASSDSLCASWLAPAAAAAAASKRASILSASRRAVRNGPRLSQSPELPEKGLSPELAELR